MRRSSTRWFVSGLAMVWLAVLPASGFASSTAEAVCAKVTLSGDTKAGAEWKADFGEGWVVRLVPIVAGKPGYTGWDIVVDRATAAGFPDALLLATPPYDSINEREVGTTFGLRAQDAIGWNPRSFRFLTDPAALHVAQQLYEKLHGTDAAKTEASQELMKLLKNASSGQLRILNAKIARGAADPAPFAQSWAIASAKTPHSVVDQAGQAAARGAIESMRFSISLWLPATWKPAKGIKAERTGCSQ